jgi:hypothetical protein
MLVKYRLVTTEEHVLDSYILDDGFGAITRVYYKNIVNYDITNACVNPSDFTCRAKSGNTIATLTLHDYNKKFVVNDEITRDIYSEFDN